MRYFEKGRVYEFTCADPDMTFQTKYPIDVSCPVHGILINRHPELLEFEIGYTCLEDGSIHTQFKLWKITVEEYQNTDIKMTRK